jgi:MoxR-like ATPase
MICLQQERSGREILRDIKSNIEKVIIGKSEVIDLVLIALICSGHVLIEDVPGLGKTTLVSALAKSLDLGFSRIQFTPDVMPSDIAGFTVFDMQTGEKQVRHGAVMSHIVLADEINRTSPKTQSALLEVMQENQVTIDGVTYPVPQPFMVLATQNPVDLAGTYPLPEAQLDRFLMRISMGYPKRDEEVSILLQNKGATAAQKAEEVGAVAGAEDVLKLRREHSEITCAQPVLEYIVSIAAATRQSDQVSLGVSPRGAIALMNASTALAMLSGRDYALPDDVQKMAAHVLSHRMIMSAQAGFKNITPELFIEDIIRNMRVPAVS